MAIPRAAKQFCAVGSIPVLAVALLLWSGAAFGQDRTEAHERDSGPGERFAVPIEPSSPPPSPEPSAPSEPTAGSSDPGPSDTSEPRTAVPTEPSDRDGRPERQPPTRHDHGGGGHGSAGVGGGYYEPYYPYGFFGFGWGSYGNDPYGSGPYPDDPDSGQSYGREPSDEMGALDLDISPGRTQVFLDGQRIGTADDFDGWPRYLWLPEGTYEVVFYLDGFKTLVRRMTIYPGLVIDMDDHMERGASTRPEDLPIGAQ